MVAVDGLDAMHAIETRQQRVRVVPAVFVVRRDQFQQQPHLLLAHGLDHETVVIRNEKHAARFSR